LEELTEKLFRLHDLNKNGVLEELELIQLNKKIAMLHSGRDTDKEAVAQKFQELFRSRLDPTGQPVPYPVFRKYIQEVLVELDPDVQAQEMILESWIAEAGVARKFFRVKSFESQSDVPFLRTMSVGSAMPLAAVYEDAQNCENGAP